MPTKQLTARDLRAAGEKMLKAPVPRNATAIRERLHALDAIMKSIPSSTEGLYRRLAETETRLFSLLSDLEAGVEPARGVLTPASWATRSTADERYAASEAAWARSQERAQMLTRRPGAWQLPPRAPKRLPNGEAPSVRLDADTEPRVTVHISKSAMTSIADECARCGEFETGGWLVGPRAPAWHADHNIVEATVAANGRTRSSVYLDASAFLAMDEHLVSERRSGKGFDLRATGDWHSHPGCVATPSAGDIACWARDLATLTDADASLTSLIVTQREGRDSWARPVVTAWITRHARSSFGERFVVEPAIVSIQ